MSATAPARTRWVPPLVLPPDDKLEREKGLLTSGFHAAQQIARRSILETLRRIDAGPYSDEYICGALDMATVLQVALLCDVTPALAHEIERCDLL